MDDETKVTSEFAMMNLNKPDDINPGLTNLNLNIMFENDIHLIQDAIAGFEQRLQAEHAVVHNVVNSKIAIIKSKFPRSRIESRSILQTVLQKDDMNLNALADLEHLCRTFHRVTEADRYKERIDTIMKGRTSAEKRAKAVCLMEQGYAILYEESANKEQLSRSKLSESYLMLLSEHRKGTGKRRDHLQRCIYHNKQTLEQLQQAMECKRQSDLHTRRTTTIEKFDQAKTIYDLQSENPVWLYYEGVAWNRKYDSLKDLCNDDEVDRKYDKMHATIKATELLWSVATRRGHFDETFTLYQSRAFAFIAHILTARDRNKDLMTYYKNLQDSSLFLDFLNNPRLPIDRALNSHGNDVFILNRYGRILWNESNIQKSISEKKDLLHQAQQALNKSLRQSPSLNWFAFTTRMTVRRDLATLYLKHNKPKAHTFFKLALEDGYQCYMTKGTSKTLCLLVQVCQYLAKFPNIYEKGFRYVVEHGYLLDALDYLHFGVHQTGPTNYYIAYHMGTILYDLNELKSAVDWMKRAFSLSNSTNTMPCKLLCLYILSRYVEERAKTEILSYS